MKYSGDQAREKLGKIEKEITEKRTSGGDAESTKELLQQKKELEASLVQIEAKTKELQNKVQDLLRTVGNIVHASVPVSDNEVNQKKYLKEFGLTICLLKNKG